MVVGSTDECGFSHSNIGVPVTLLGREMEQLSSTVFPAMTGMEGEVVMEIFAGSVEKMHHICITCLYKGIPKVICLVTAVLGSIVELADILIVYVAPTTSSWIVML